MGQWAYEPEKGKWKHGWKHPHAGYIYKKRVRIGKCPKGTSMDRAQEALDRGIPWNPPNWKKDYPHCLFTVLDGIIYKLAISNAGKSYHGFPFPAVDLKRSRSLQQVLEKLEVMAIELKCIEGFEHWVKKDLDIRSVQ